MKEDEKTNLGINLSRTIAAFTDTKLTADNAYLGSQNSISPIYLTQIFPLSYFQRSDQHKLQSAYLNFQFVPIVL